MAIEQKKREELHLGRIRISMAVIWELLQLPNDYQIRSTYINSSTNCIDIVVEHESLPAVDEATPIPEVVPTYTRAYLPDYLNQVELTDIKVI